ncbi:OmpA family protein [Prevotella histicola]|uniref:OmpA family protein n=1 Tax=Prevotella histicola TaxID=470565 RepID=UPI003C7364BC
MKNRILTMATLTIISMTVNAQAFISDAEKDYVINQQLEKKQSYRDKYNTLEGPDDIIYPEAENTHQYLKEEKSLRGIEALNKRVKWSKVKELGTEENSDSLRYQDSYFFYFKENLDEFTDKNQLSYINDIISLLKANENLTVKIYGAADSRTGNTADNRLLAIRRAKLISRYIKEAGIEKKRLHGYSLGGIDTFPTKEANRLACVIIYKGIN